MIDKERALAIYYKNILQKYLSRKISYTDYLNERIQNYQKRLCIIDDLEKAIGVAH